MSETDDDTDACTFVNSLCPSDLCILPYGHPFMTRHRHITLTTYGSANTSYEEQMELLKDPKITGWHKSNHYLAPRGTPEDELIRLGWEMQERFDRKTT